MAILDLHTHHLAPQPEGIVAVRYDGKIEVLDLLADQAYSAGIHPWDTGVAEIPESMWRGLEKLCELPQVVAIGECGVDLTPHGGPTFRQLLEFKRHIELSERLGKPMVIHDVKGHDIVVACRRDLHPKQAWAIHGFRGKPEAARMLLKRGCWLSFGMQFNIETLKEMPEDRILAETDMADATIEDVIARISAVRGKDMTAVIAANTLRFLGK